MVKCNDVTCPSVCVCVCVPLTSHLALIKLMNACAYCTTVWPDVCYREYILNECMCVLVCGTKRSVL